MKGHGAGDSAAIAPAPQAGSMTGVPIAWPMPLPDAAASSMPAGVVSGDPTAPPAYAGAAAMPLAAPYAAPPPQPRTAAL